ncbi:MAG: hypothetical protein K2W97_07125 [Chthoniobacterales bacterium]|nr:hypothetical protein [Chthoniobacterales bacterium]
MGAFKSFVQSEIQASKEWKNTCQFLHNSLYASMAWNVVAGAGVISRIDPRIIIVKLLRNYKQLTCPF